jgi:indole-3-glycerol phosphate synthase
VGAAGGNAHSCAPRFSRRPLRAHAGHHRGNQEGVAEQGLLAADFVPARIAAAYQAGGAAALSVLTDAHFFQGSLTDLEQARAAVTVPVLRKDFTIAPEQIVEAAAHGADCILLIAAILGERELRDFREAAARWRMAALVEVHNRRELDGSRRGQRHHRREQSRPHHVSGHAR